MINNRHAKNKPVENIARPQPISASQSELFAIDQIFQRSFNPDYDQILKRISDAPQGERHGSPIGPVGI